MGFGEGGDGCASLDHRVPTLCEPAAVNVFNYAFLLYRASYFHLHASHLHLRTWLLLLLSSTAPIFPHASAGGTQQSWRSILSTGDPFGDRPVLQLPCTPHVMPRTIRELGRASLMLGVPPCRSSQF